MNWRAYFMYDAKTGVLRWAVDRGRVRRGDVAGSLTGSKRYLTVHIHGKRYQAHRIVWEMCHGQIQEGMCIDHVNRDGHDNRIANLRAVSLSENQRNRNANWSSITGVPGVTPHSNGRGFNVQCAGDYIGYFTDFKAAVSARRRAEACRGYLHINTTEATHHANA